METDENGLYYMRARYYNTDIKRFINRDIIDGTIQNSQSLNKYSYVQGNPISLTDPFGLCPDFSGIMEYLKMVGHTLLDIAGFIPVVGFGADLANAYWYRCEGNQEMAMASVISAIPGMGDAFGAILKGAGMVAKCQKLVKAADVVIDTSRFVGAVAQTELNVENFKLACASVAEEYKTTGSVSFWNGANLALSAVGVGVGAASIAGSARKLSSYGSMGSQKATTVCEWGCFVAGTPVKTEDGQKNIEDIKAGDLVYAKNTETGEEGYKEVVRVFIKNVNKLVHLQIDETKIDTTTNHPFWVVGYGFKEAGELQAGEKVLTATGEIKTITSIVVEELETPVTVYNFEVQDWHTYYVSELEVLVHNMCEVAGKSNSSGAAGAISESGSKLQWGNWNDYDHVSMGGNEYAEIGERLYTRHAVARMQPSGMRYSSASDGGKVGASRILGAGELDYGRSISPNYIEDIINTGKVSTKTVNGVERTIFSSGTVNIVTEENGKIVVTILTH